MVSLKKTWVLMRNAVQLQHQVADWWILHWNMLLQYCQHHADRRKMTIYYWKSISVMSLWTDGVQCRVWLYSQSSTGFPLYASYCDTQRDLNVQMRDTPSWKAISLRNSFVLFFPTVRSYALFAFNVCGVYRCGMRQCSGFFQVLHATLGSRRFIHCQIWCVCFEGRW